MKKVLLAYVPVLHEGYIKLFNFDFSIKTLFIFGPELIKKYDPLRKDVRALSPSLMKDAVAGLGIFQEISVVEEAFLNSMNGDSSISDFIVVMPEDDVSHQIAEEYLKDCTVEFVPIFLRWDKKRTLAQTEVSCDRIVEGDVFSNKMMDLAFEEAQKSPDWWRQVGAIAVTRDQSVMVIITAFNTHVPSKNHVFAFGDPRGNFKKGVHFELSPALHSEAAVIAKAAKSRDLCLEGADLYVTTFPCPPCARIIAYSGIKRLFFSEGYSVYDGADLLKSQGVEIIWVKS